jgi:hypothetical protein
LPKELTELFDKEGIKTLEMADREGLSSHHKKETNRLYRDKEKWRMWAEMLLKTCTHSSVVGSTEHFLLVGKKQS